VLLGALKRFAGTVIFVSHDRHFISNLATGVLEMKAGAAKYFPGDYEYYLAKSGQEDAEAAATAQRAASTQEKSPTVTQFQRLEDKRLKSELRALEREEEAILARLESLEGARKETEDEMARPEVYADGKRMRELGKAHEENARMHQEESRRWEDVVSRASDLKARMAGLRNGTAAR
jgi:ATP-binding cassette subfamily F protein 3